MHAEVKLRDPPLGRRANVQNRQRMPAAAMVNSSRISREFELEALHFAEVLFPRSLSLDFRTKCHLKTFPIEVE